MNLTEHWHRGSWARERIFFSSGNFMRAIFEEKVTRKREGKRERRQADQQRGRGESGRESLRRKRKRKRKRKSAPERKYLHLLSEDRVFVPPLVSSPVWFEIRKNRHQHRRLAHSSCTYNQPTPCMRTCVHAYIPTTYMYIYEARHAHSAVVHTTIRKPETRNQTRQDRKQKQQI